MRGIAWWRIAGCLTALFASACDDIPRARSKNEIERIAQKQAADFTGPLINRSMVQDVQISELKRRIDFLERDLRIVAGTSASPPRPAPMTHQLVGVDFNGTSTFRYPNLARCEAAKQKLVADREAADEAARARGIIYTSRPDLSCIPI